MTFPFPIPEPPHFTFDFDALDREFEFVRALRGCPQDPIWHAEGDVWIHTRMVLESLVALRDFRVLPASERAVVFAAALLHDVAKPLCTREEAGRITSRGHSLKGEGVARQILWQHAVDPFDREQVARLIEVHQLPFFAIEKENAGHLVRRTSQTVSNRLLALLAEADARGRKATDKQRLLDHIELFRELALEEACLDGPFEFASDHARVRYFFRGDHGQPRYVPHDDTWGEVLVMSGLPASGKDTWLSRHVPDLPVVSLDALRHELDVDPEDAQGPVVQAARERAREHLRAKRPFAWNATNLSREQRGAVTALAFDYGARVRIVHLEVTREAQRQRNGARSKPVPAQAISRMLGRWQPPDRTEAHVVELDGNNIHRYT